MVDNLGVTRPFPARSMITGLLGNALGYDHRDVTPLQALQERLWFATRCDRTASPLIDYQTVDLGQPAMRETGWTTEGTVETRGGGKAKTGTHERHRHYLADAIYTVAVTLRPAEVEPTIETIATALAEPARPLFLGRKCCIPSVPLILAKVEATSLVGALRGAPSIAETRRRSTDGPHHEAWWPAEEEGDEVAESRLLPVTDERDWSNQIHVGRRFLRHGLIERQGDHHGR